VLTIDPRETLMPFFVNSLKLLELRGARIGRTAALSLLALVLGLAVALPATLHWQYAEGANLSDRFATWGAAGFAYRNTLRLKQRMEAQGIDANEGARAAGLRGIRPINPSVFWTAAISCALVVGFSLARMRLSWWPLHPVLFLVCAGWGTAVVGPSFLMGWLVKSFVTKYGGIRVYHRLKPVFIGIVAGEFLSALVPIVGSLAYYACTGELPRSFSVFPG
jgi:hypothetical protein